MRVSFDIDELLEQIRDVDKDTIVAMIYNEDVLDYLACNYIDDGGIIYGVVKNSSTSKKTIMFIANKVLEHKDLCSFNYLLIIHSLKNDDRLPKNTREKLAKLLIE